MADEHASTGATAACRAPSAPPLLLTFQALRDAAAALLRKADEIAALGPPAPLEQQWQAVFATARAAISPPVEESAAIAARGMRTLVGWRAALEAQRPAGRAHIQALAAAAVDLQAGGQTGAAAAFASLVIEMSGESEATELLPFFVCLQALVRTRLAHDAGGERAHSARAFWQIAVREAGATARARLVLCAGLSGSGKSFVGTGVAATLGAAIVASDRVRKELAGLRPTERVPDARSRVIYGGAMSDRVYAHLLRRAELELSAGRSVLLDATYLTRRRREPPLALATRLGAPAVLLWCRLSQQAASARLRDRAGQGWAVSVADARIRALQRHGLQLPAQAECGAPVLFVDSGAAPATLFERLLPRLQRALAPR